jgi:hypothetical protein
MSADVDSVRGLADERKGPRTLHIRSLHARAGEPGGFDADLADPRQGQRPKTKLLRLPTRRGRLRIVTFDPRPGRRPEGRCHMTNESGGDGMHQMQFPIGREASTSDRHDAVTAPDDVR